jgi:hypothetical protein
MECKALPELVLALQGVLIEPHHQSCCGRPLLRTAGARVRGRSLHAWQALHAWSIELLITSPGSAAGVHAAPGVCLGGGTLASPQQHTETMLLSASTKLRAMASTVQVEGRMRHRQAPCATVQCVALQRQQSCGLHTWQVHQQQVLVLLLFYV